MSQRAGSLLATDTTAVLAPLHSGVWLSAQAWRKGRAVLSTGAMELSKERELTQAVHRSDVSACQLSEEGGKVLLTTVAGDAQERQVFFFAQKHQSLFSRLRCVIWKNSQCLCCSVVLEKIA